MRRNTNQRYNLRKFYQTELYPPKRCDVQLERFAVRYQDENNYVCDPDFVKRNLKGGHDAQQNKNEVLLVSPAKRNLFADSDDSFEDSVDVLIKSSSEEDYFSAASSVEILSSDDENPVPLRQWPIKSEPLDPSDLPTATKEASGLVPVIESISNERQSSEENYEEEGSPSVDREINIKKPTENFEKSIPFVDLIDSDSSDLEFTPKMMSTIDLVPCELDDSDDDVSILSPESPAPVPEIKLIAVSGGPSEVNAQSSKAECSSVPAVLYDLSESEDTDGANSYANMSDSDNSYAAINPSRQDNSNSTEAASSQATGPPLLDWDEVRIDNDGPEVPSSTDTAETVSDAKSATISKSPVTALKPASISKADGARKGAEATELEVSPDNVIEIDEEDVIDLT